MTMRNVAGKWRGRHTARREAGIVLVCEATRVGRDGATWNDAENAPGEDAGPEDELYYRRVVVALKRAVEGHAVRERALEWMFAERDVMTLEDVSQECGVPVAALKAAVTWIRREFKRLRAAEGKDG
jgi:DNA-directed RNA polymerase specialized sigma24 family protein